MTTLFGAKSTADEVLAGTKLVNKRYLVTGVSSGIGLETARSLVAHGATVIGAVRDIAKAELASEEIKTSALNGGGKFELVQLDLGSLASVKACANYLLEQGEHFDGIIANAGVMATPFGKTDDGFETQFGINYVGHFALVNMLMPLLIKGGRVIVLSSQAHRVADIDLADPNFDSQDYHPFVAYGRSKTATTLFAKELDQRYREKGIRAASVMPGNSLTELPRNFSQEELQGLFETVGKARAEAGLPPGELKEISQAAATSVWAAVVADMNEIGGLYLEDCAVSPVNAQPNPFADGVMPYALDPVSAKKLWDWTENAISKR